MSALAFVVGNALSRAVPGRVRYGSARLLGGAGYLAGGRARRNALANYGAILGLPTTDPRVGRVARDAMVGYAKLLADFLLLPSLSAADVLDRVDVIGMENIFDGLKAGRGVIAVTPHFGNWDMAGAAAVAMGVPVTAVTERFGSESLNRRVVASRERAGVEVVPLGRGSGKAVLSALRRNRAVALVCDLPKEGRNLVVDLLGQRAEVPAGPAVLSLRTGAPIVPITCRRLPDNRYLLEVQAPVEFHPTGAPDDAARLAQVYIDRLAPLLRAHPEQWYLFSPMWSSAVDPTPERAALVAR